MYSIPEELPAGTIVASVTAEDPDDDGSFPGHLLYSITMVSKYFMIDQCESQTTISKCILVIQPLGLFYLMLPSLWPGVCLSVQGHR